MVFFNMARNVSLLFVRVLRKQKPETVDSDVIQKQQNTTFQLLTVIKKLEVVWELWLCF